MEYVFSVVIEAITYTPRVHLATRGPICWRAPTLHNAGFHQQKDDKGVRLDVRYLGTLQLSRVILWFNSRVRRGHPCLLWALLPPRHILTSSVVPPPPPATKHTACPDFEAARHAHSHPLRRAIPQQRNDHSQNKTLLTLLAKVGKRKGTFF